MGSHSTSVGLWASVGFGTSKASLNFFGRLLRGSVDDFLVFVMGPDGGGMSCLSLFADLLGLWLSNVSAAFLRDHLIEEYCAAI